MIRDILEKLFSQGQQFEIDSKAGEAGNSQEMITKTISRIKTELIVEIDKLQEITLTERGFGGTLVIKSNLVDKSQIIEIIEKA